MFHYQVQRRVEEFGNPRPRERDLVKLATGDWIASSAWSEFGAGADKSNLRTRFDRVNGHAVVNGEKHFCTGLASANVVHVLLDAGTDGTPAPTFVSVECDKPGVTKDDIFELMGLRGSSTGTLTLNDVRVSEADLVGPVGAGMDLMKSNHEFLMNPGLLAMGIASEAYDTVVPTVKGIGEGARDISGYQNTRMILAHIEDQLGAAYAYAAEIIRSMLQGGKNRQIMCIKIKAHASDMACNVTQAVQRLAGAKGLATRWPFERHFRDAQATVLMGPSNEIIREKIAGAVLSTAGRT